MNSSSPDSNSETRQLTPYELAVQPKPDSRSEEQVAADIIDPELIDFLHENGLIGVPEGTIYTYKEHLDDIRRTWAYATKGAIKDPEGTANFVAEGDAAEYRAWKSRQLTDDERTALYHDWRDRQPPTGRPAE